VGRSSHDVFTVGADADDAGRFETLHGLAVGEFVEHREADRLADGDDLECRPLPFVEGPEAVGD
jgi:hypothetical protein